MYVYFLGIEAEKHRNMIFLTHLTNLLNTQWFLWTLFCKIVI